MSTELFYLFLSSLLLAVLWIPYVVGLAKTKGPLRPEEYVTLRDASGCPDWVRRANRAHVNLVEQFGAFAGLVLVANAIGLSNSITQAAAAVFFFARLAHAVIMISGFKQFMARTLVFVVAFLSLIAIASQIAVAGW